MPIAEGSTDAGELIETCTGCTLASESWTSPVMKDGEPYCCAACAEGKVCDCGAEIQAVSGQTQTEWSAVSKD